MAMRGPRHPIGAAPWIAEERTTAVHIAQSEADEFMFSAKNEMDWLNEHMAEIFSENQINVADIFKTPGKLRGKTPRATRKVNKGDMRAPLTDVFAATPKGAEPNPFAVSKLGNLQQQQRRLSPSFKVAEDKPPRASLSKTTAQPAAQQRTKKAAGAKTASAAKKPAATNAPSSFIDSGYHGSQSQDAASMEDDDEDELAAGPATRPFAQPARPMTPEPANRKPATTISKAASQTAAASTATTVTTMVPLVTSPDEMAEDRPSPTQPTATFHSAKEEQTAEVTATARPPVLSSPTVAVESSSSSPFCPVESPSPVRITKASSPQKNPAASPTRKPVPQPSSPLQSTTPACPPPRELLSAMGVAPAVAASSPAPTPVQVPPAVPTPPTAAIPAFIASKTSLATTSKAQHADYAVEAQNDEEKEEEEEEQAAAATQGRDQQQDEEEEITRSPSDPSSPVRPIVRKSSLNFASLPAREPFTSNKSMGGASAGMSRASHIDPGRTSYYNRLTGGKSLGNVRPAKDEEEDHDDDMDAESNFTAQNAVDGENGISAHNKTYAQRLHDRISMLGKSQANGPRPSKSLASHLPGANQNALTSLAQQQQQNQQKSLQQQQQQQQQEAAPSPKRNANSVAAPGAFPEDNEEDDDDWILSPPAAGPTSPRLLMAKSLASAKGAKEPTPAASTQPEFVLPKQRQQDTSRPASPKRGQAPIIPERTTSTVSGHVKSASVPSLAIVDPAMLATTKPISVSNPSNSALAVVSEMDDQPPTPSKSPSRNYRDSPLKHVKNKLSSILKSSKGLLASSAAISAEGKSSLLSPSTTRLGLLLGPSTETLALKSRNGSVADLSRPDLSRQTSATSVLSGAPTAAPDVSPIQESPTRPESPSRPIRKTRASTERERRELKQREKELKEVQRMAEQMGKLEKMREKEREKARVFSEEREKTEKERAMATAEKHAKEAAEREQIELKEQQQQQAQHNQLKAQKQQQPQMEEEEDDVVMITQESVSKPKPQTSSPARAPAKATRSSPRKQKTQQVEVDVDMADATTASMLPPPPPAHGTVSSTSSAPRSAQSTRTIRRPIKPTKEAPAKTKQAPTVIRVNTSSSQQQQQSQFHPSNSVLAATLHETLVGPSQQQHTQPHQLKNKSSTASLHMKPSLQSLKSSVSSSGRPKALELAAKRKEQEEREAQRKRDAKAEMERKRAALQEQEEERRLELQRQREREREQANAEAATAKKAAAAQQRQAAIEKAKQTRAPPPAARTQLPSGPPAEYERKDAPPPRPQSRLATAAGAHRSQEELHRPVNAVLSNAGKSLSKRPLPGTEGHEVQGHGRPGTAGGGAGNNGNMPAYQSKDAKRIRMSEEFDEDELEMGGHDARVSSIKGPPVRPSGAFKKDLPNKSVFGNGYATAPASANISRDLFKATVTAQHNHQTRAGHPMDMAQVSKAAISFAANTSAATAAAAAAAASAAGPSSASAVPSANPHKTPLRPGGAPLTGKSTAKSTAKSAAKSSPRFPNGDGIELPEIQTDDEDSEDDGHVNVAPWADSPDLRRALMRQETVDPFQVFGPPGPLNMEEVFNKSKDRWHKFRARTSSANWSGADRLTEEDIRKDLAARDKIRREGGWTYELSRDMM